MAYIYNTPTQVTVTLTDTAVHALFATATPCKSAFITPHPANVGTVACDYLATPVLQGGLTLPATPDSQAGFLYNLASLNAQASNGGDKLVVIYFN